MRIDYSKIFRISNDGIYYDGGVFYYEKIIKDVDGFSGQTEFSNGEFTLSFYDDSNFTVVFSINSFSEKLTATTQARAKLGSFILFLQEKNLKIKSL